jgi:D-alanyl-D-alanine carboxypeptidase (penicillin-binding protein 5/6)
VHPAAAVARVLAPCAALGIIVAAAAPAAPASGPPVPGVPVPGPASGHSGQHSPAPGSPGPARPAAARPAAARPAAARPAAARPAAGRPAAGRPRRHGLGPRGPVIGGPRLASQGIVVRYPARGGWRLPAVPAAGYVIADAGTGAVLAAKDPHGRFRPASTLQILTADTLMPVLRPDAAVVTSPVAARGRPAAVRLVAGRRYRVSDLFRAMLLVPANDAAIALAQATGSYRRGVALMNAEARRLRADDTAARQPGGLDASGQHSSAYDLALFARQALAIPALMRIEADRAATFPLSRQHLVTLDNRNTMLGRYRGDLGGKAGWTAASKATFIGWARRHGHTLIVTIMRGAPGAGLASAARLLNWGFAMDGRVRPAGILVRPRPGPGPGRRAVMRPRPAAVPVAAVRPPGIPAVMLAAGAGVLLALLMAGGIALAVRRPPRAGSPPGP